MDNLPNSPNFLTIQYCTCIQNDATTTVSILHITTELVNTPTETKPYHTISKLMVGVMQPRKVELTHACIYVNNTMTTMIKTHRRKSRGQGK